MGIQVLEEKCRGCGMCIGIDSSLMQMNAHGKAEGIACILAGHEDKAQLIARVCPVRAVVLN